MPRKVNKISFNEGKARSTAWAVTFGDMVTLLLTFFILIIVIMNEAEKQIDQIIDMLLDETYKELKIELSDIDVQVDRVTKGVKITMGSNQLFQSADAELKQEVLPTLDQIGQLIKNSRIVSLEKDSTFQKFVEAIEKNNKSLNIEIRTEGHTDNLPLPLKLQNKWKSNWELSTARALNVVTLLSKYSGLPQNKFSAMGYGEFRPLYQNKTVDGRSRNRRVEIYLDAFVTIKVENENLTPL